MNKKPANKSAAVTIPAPNPTELAKLAAILRPAPRLIVSLEDSDRMRREDLDEAMRYYLEAFLYCRELPTDFDNLLAVFGSEQRNAALGRQAHARVWGQVLKLEPEKDTDEVREFLAGEAKMHGYKGRCFWRQSRGVLSALREYRKHNLAEGAELDNNGRLIRRGIEVLTAAEFVSSFKREEAGKHWWDIPGFILTNLVPFKMQRASEVVKKGWATKKKKAVNKDFSEKEASDSLRGSS